MLYGELMVMIKSVWDSMFSENIMANVFGAGIAANKTSSWDTHP
jgi:hypothetical protein